MDSDYPFGLCPGCHLPLRMYYGVVGCPRCKATAYFQPIDGRANKAGHDGVRGWRPLGTIGLSPQQVRDESPSDAPRR